MCSSQNPAGRLVTMQGFAKKTGHKGIHCNYFLVYTSMKCRTAEIYFKYNQQLTLVAAMTEGHEVDTLRRYMCTDKSFEARHDMPTWVGWEILDPVKMSSGGDRRTSVWTRKDDNIIHHDHPLHARATKFCRVVLQMYETSIVKPSPPEFSATGFFHHVTVSKHNPAATLPMKRPT